MQPEAQKKTPEVGGPSGVIGKGAGAVGGPHQSSCHRSGQEEHTLNGAEGQEGWRVLP